MAASFQKRSPGLGTTRKRDWEALKESTRKRYERYGITPSYYERGGLLQRARGHLPREHITRRERNPLSLTSTDYHFLATQQRRAAKEDFGNEIAAYRRLTPDERIDFRKRVASDYREYKRQKSRSGIVRGSISELFLHYRNIYPVFKKDYVALMFYH